MADTSKQIPLRLNRRRDGTYVLTDADGRAAGENRQFPPRHTFSWDWLAGRGQAIARLEDGQVVLRLLNGRATYNVVEQGPGGVLGEIADTELFDAPAVNESLAEQVQADLSGDVATASGSVASGGQVSVEEGN